MRPQEPITIRGSVRQSVCPFVHWSVRLSVTRFQKFKNRCIDRMKRGIACDHTHIHTNRYTHIHKHAAQINEIADRDLRFHDLTTGPVPVRFHAISRCSGSGSGSYSLAKSIYYFSYTAAHGNPHTFLSAFSWVHLLQI